MAADKRRSRNWSLFSSYGVWLLMSLLGWRDVAASGYDRPAGDPQQSRSLVMARHGMVATSQPLATQAGLDVLKAGGNAIDAAIAANAMLGVVEPASCGIGGDLFVIYWDSKTGKTYGLNASGRSPRSLTRDVFRQRKLDQIPVYGPLSWSVPGCVSGWDALTRRFGTKSWRELLGPAIAVARDGFPVTEVIAAEWAAAAERLREWPDSATTFLLEGRRAPRSGELFRNPRLAATYQRLADQGSEEFYRGSIAAQIAAFSAQHGGFLEERDFREHTSDWIEPVSTSYRGHEVWELPPSGQGIAVLQMLNVLSQFDLRNFGPAHPDYLHLLIEAKKLAYADRARYYTDPNFSRVPLAGLISPEYGRRQAARIQLDRAAKEVLPGDPGFASADTIYLTVVDRERNCCSFIQSNFHGFGSQVVPGELGFPLQNRGQLFALADDHPNRLEPGKRPFHTIIPGLVTKGGKPCFCFGVMGGDMQPQGQVQVLVNMLDFGLNPQAAGDAARIQHLGSATPTGLPAREGGVVAVESGISAETIQTLRDKGHEVVRQVGGFGGYQGIWIDWEQGVLHGASDPRKDGCAAGY